MYPKLLAAIYDRKDLKADWGWETIVDSSVVKAQNPYAKIFEIAESKVSCPPSEILFIENGQKHVDAAKSRSWQTFHYDSSHPEKSSHDLLQFMHAKFLV